MEGGEAPLLTAVVVNNTQKESSSSSVYILSFAFLFIFLAYGAAQNLQTTLNTVRLSLSSLVFFFFFFFFYNYLINNWHILLPSKQEHALGTTSLGILYTSFTFFSLIASIVVRNLGSKNALVLGTTGYWLFVAANLKPTW